jgi:medium-chain acyl-[acyl-carrier-protein] hydrolase
MTPWLIRSRPLARPRIRLLCLPFAGGGTAVFRPWGDALPADVELAIAQLPGRECRLAEPPETDIAVIVAALTAALLALPAAPLAIYGQSMGAALAHDLALALTRAGRPPALLAVAARGAPHLPPRRPPVHRLETADFIAAIRKMGGTPDEVLDHAELMDLLMPSLRADFALSETFHRAARRIFHCPLLALAGNDDSLAPEDDVRAWGDYAAKRFRFAGFPGGHFFPQRQAGTVVRLILDTAADDGITAKEAS